MHLDLRCEGAAGRNLSEGMRDKLLVEARQVGRETLRRMRSLSNQLPAGVVEQLEQLHYSPTRERRKATRVADESVPVCVQIVDQSESEGAAKVKDHCPTGLAVLLPCPAGEGVVLRVRMPPELGDGGWVSVEVRHCRREKEGWVAGCALLTDQPPI